LYWIRRIRLETKVDNVIITSGNSEIPVRCSYRFIPFKIIGGQWEVKEAIIVTLGERKALPDF
jgi:hypothetical protein